MSGTLPEIKDNLKNYSFLVFGFLFVCIVNGAIPILTIPTLAQAVGTTVGWAQAFVNNGLFSIYSTNFGYPEPAARSFGLAGVFITGIFLRLGVNGPDAYALMVVFWLAIAYGASYKIARVFGASRLIATMSALLWCTHPIVWAHAGYSMLSLGIALLPFYFLSVVKLFYSSSTHWNEYILVSAFYVVACVISVFMDGYTFMMFAFGSSILLFYALVMRPQFRVVLLKIGIPTHVVGFALAYYLYTSYIGYSSSVPHSLDLFRGWGLDLSFLFVPTKGVLWLPDMLGLSVSRSQYMYFGDSSVWNTTFALPILLFGVFAWWRIRNRLAISTGVLFVGIIGFYMALGPSLKINSTKPEELQNVSPSIQIMSQEHGLIETGNAWISEKLPGFKAMRASYRWSALGVFSLWLMVVIFAARSKEKEKIIIMISFLALTISNLPNLDKHYQSKSNFRSMFLEIDRDLIKELKRDVLEEELVAFIPWGNDLLANYLASASGFRAFNIGGDKNLAVARNSWPYALSPSLGKNDFQFSSYEGVVLLFANSDADVVIVPYFDLFKHSHKWPPSDSQVNQLRSRMYDFEEWFSEAECFEMKRRALYSLIRPVKSEKCELEISATATNIQDKVDIELLDWGPKTTRSGVVPNLQPGGRAGLWVSFINDSGLSDFRLYFDGEPALLTHVRSGVVTAAISPSFFYTAGHKPVVIKHLSTGKEFEVGTFVVRND